jgi:hypothetical protein
MTELEVVRSQAAARSAERLKTEEQLAADIEALARLEATQLKQIEEAEATLAAREEARQAAAAEANRRVREEEERLIEMRALQTDAEAQLQLKALATRELKAEVEALRKSDAKRLKEIEKLEARRSEAEAAALQRAEQEARLLAELESIRARVESNEAAWPEKELSLEAQIAAQRKAERIQLKRIEKVEERLREQEESRQSAAPTAKARNAKSGKGKVKPTAKTPAARRAQEEQNRIARLEAIGAETELEMKRRSKKEQLLHSKIRALYKAEAEQLQRLEEANARLRAREKALEAQAQEESRLLAEAAHQQEPVELLSAGAEIKTSQLSVQDSYVETEPGVAADFEAGLDTSLASESQIGAEAQSLHPLETWQFALIDEPLTSVNDLEQTEQLATTMANRTDGIEQLHDEIEELDFDLQAELSKFEADPSVFITGNIKSNAGDEEVIDVISEDWATSSPDETFESSFVPEPISATEGFEKSLDKSLDLVQTEKGLQASGREQSRSALAEALKSGDPVQRAEALLELAQWDDADSFSLITDLFDDPAAEVRNAAARALHEFKPDRAASFTRALREGSMQRRRNIASALSGSGLANEAINSLVGEGREKTYDAFSILFLMAKAGEVQTLLQTIEKHADIAVRLSVIRLLTFSNQPDIIPAFRSLAVRGSLPTEVRSAVMEAIYQISSNVRDNSLSAA